jgi:hypothetical protein
LRVRQKCLVNLLGAALLSAKKKVLEHIKKIHLELLYKNR